VVGNNEEWCGVLVTAGVLMRDVLMERALVDRLRAGDATAVLDLQAAYGAKIYQLALRYMKNHEDAE